MVIGVIGVHNKDKSLTHLNGKRMQMRRSNVITVSVNTESSLENVAMKPAK